MPFLPLTLAGAFLGAIVPVDTPALLFRPPPPIFVGGGHVSDHFVVFFLSHLIDERSVTIQDRKGESIRVRGSHAISFQLSSTGAAASQASGMR